MTSHRGTLLNQINAEYLAGLLAIAMLCGWAAGWRRGQAVTNRFRGSVDSKFTDAILALLGLLLAFTFSMSLERHEQRRQMVVTDSNSIGDFYTTCGLLHEPVRSRLLDVVRRYAEHRLTIARGRADEATLQIRLAEARGMHQEMEALVKQAIDDRTTVVVPLVNTLNALTSSHAARLAAYHDRVPASVIGLVSLAALISMVVMGWQRGVAGESHLGAMLGFTALVSLVLWVILDLNQPHRGGIIVSQEPLEQLLKSMQD